jgi:phenylacetic acid degradation operon negative regulatory protein
LRISTPPKSAEAQDSPARAGAASSALASLDAAFGLRAQEIVLGLVGEYVKVGDQIWSGGLVSLLEDLGFTQGTSRTALSRVVARGLLERIRQGRRIFYSISPRLEQVLADGRRQTYFFQDEHTWNGDWTFVWYSIPDSHLVERRRLSRRLSFLGFGAVQDGTWAIPRDYSVEVARLIEQLSLNRYVAVVVGRIVDRDVGIAAHVATIWNIDELNENYRLFTAAFSAFRSTQAVAGLSETDSFVFRTRAIDAFRQLAAKDPKLPATVMPANWIQPAAVELFTQVTHRLYPKASKHFQAAMAASDAAIDDLGQP